MSGMGLLGELEQLVLLAILRLEAEAYAVSIHREITSCTGLKPSIGSVYVTLDRLERKGYLHSWFDDATPERGGRHKRFFKVEPVALAALNRTKQAFQRMWDELDLEPES